MPGVGWRGNKLEASELVFLGLMVLVIWVGEDPSGQGTISPWFISTFLGVPLNYVLLVGLILLLLPYVTATPRFSLVDRLKGSGLWPWVVLTWGVVVLALARALLSDAPELFADWRNLAVTAIVALVASKWLAAQEWSRFALVDLAITFGLLCLPILIGYVMGSGASVGGVRTPVFEATALYLACFAAIVGIWTFLLDTVGLGRARVILLVVASTAAGLVVLLSLRRSFWVVLGVGALVVTTAYLRSRQVQGVRLYVFALVGTAVVVGAFVTLGLDTVTSRLQSFNPDSEGPFSVTNQDHVNDLVDAWAVIEERPILGFGIGVRYQTNLIAEWKQDSFDVHNATLHAWLKFGVFGALAYLGFHIAWARHALRRPFTSMVPIGGFLVGMMVATMVATWPYGSFQMAVFMGILLAVALIDSPLPATTGRPQSVVATASLG